MRSNASAARSRPTSSSGPSRPCRTRLAQKAALHLEALRSARASRSIQTAASYLPHPPSSKQELFLRTDAEEVLFGGAAGGGKSDALLMAALQYVDVPGYSALILRRTYADLSLPGAIMDRSLEWWMGTAAHWDGETKTWTFPTRAGQAPATISFGYLQTEGDKYRYQGAELQLVCFDELTQFTESQYTYLFSRLRRLKGSTVPLRMRAASNPGGAGHDWVKTRFIVPATRGDRVFIPAFLADNPGIDRAAYVRMLARLDPVTRRQLEDGDWDAVPGGAYFRPEWFRYLDARPAGLRWQRYWDLAATEALADGGGKGNGGRDPDWTAGTLMALERLEHGGNRILIADARRKRGTPGAIEAFIRATAEADGRRVPIRLEEEPGSAGKNNTHNYKSRVLFGFDAAGHRKTGEKSEMWKPLSAQAEAGNLYLVRGPWNEELVRELCALPYGSHDDQADSAAGNFALLAEPTAAERTRLLANSR